MSKDGRKLFNQDLQYAIEHINNVKEGKDIEILDKDGNKIAMSMDFKLHTSSDKVKFNIDVSGVNNEGTFEEEFFLKAILGGFMLTNDLANLQENFTYKENITLFDFDAVLNTFSCTFTPAGTAVAQDRQIEPVRFEVAFELCKDDLRKLWQALNRQGIITNGESIPQVEDALMFYMSVAISRAIDNAVWNADKTGTTGTFLDQIDGYLAILKIAANDANPELHPVIVPTPQPLDETNILPELKRLRKLMPPEWFTKGGVTIYMSRANIENYKMALLDDDKTILLVAAILQNVGATDVAHVYTEGNWILPFLYDPSVRLAGIRDIPNDVIAATYKDNLWIGRLASGETDTVDILDMEAQNLDSKVRFKMTSSIDAQIGYPNEVAYYGPSLT